MKRHSFITRLASLAVVCGLTLAFASCANDDLAQNGKTSTDDKGLTAFSTGEPATRTTMEADGKFYWEAGDKIWVKDDSGNSSLRIKRKQSPTPPLTLVLQVIVV